MTYLLLLSKKNTAVVKIAMLLLCLLSYYPLKAQSEFLLSPSYEDLERLSEVYEVTGRPLAVQFVYNPKTNDFRIGIAISEKLRNGVHARLMVETHLASDLADARYNSKIHGYYAGTFFIERQNGEPVLGLHSRNSFRSTINIERRYVKKVPLKILQRISYVTKMPIGPVSKKLDRVINGENLLRGQSGVSRNSGLKSVTPGDLINSMTPRNIWDRFRGNLPNIYNYSQPQLVERIWQTRKRAMGKILVVNGEGRVEMAESPKNLNELF